MRLLNGLLAVALFAAPIFAGTQEVAEFCGLYDSDAASIIPDCSAQAALNVESNLGSTALLKRQGYTQIAALSIATSPVTGSAYFKDSSGNEIIVVCSGRNCASSRNGAAFINFYSTASAAATQYSFVAWNGALYGADNAHDAIWKYDGTSFTNPAGIPACSILALDQDRMICANTTAAPNSANYSKSGDYTIWTPGVNSPDPFVDFIGTPGDQVTGVSYWLGVLYIFKQYSIMACSPGDQYTTTCTQLNTFTGTTDGNSIVQAPGGLYFKGTDQNFWKYDGYSFSITSLKIQNTIKTFAAGSTGFNIQTGQSNWQAGTQNPSGSWNTTIVNGSILNSTFTLVDSSSANFSLGTCAGCGESPRGDVLFAGVTSTYVWRYDANVTLTNDGWTGRLVSPTSQSVSASTLTLTTTAVATGQSYQKSIGTGTNKILVFRAAINNTGSTSSDFNIAYGDSSANNQSAGIKITNSAVSYGIASVLLNESIAQPSYSTYTIIVTSNSEIDYYRNGIFKASTTVSNSSTTATDAFINSAWPSSGKSYAWIKLLHVSTGIPSPGTSDIVAVATFTSRIIDTSYSTPIVSISISSFPISGTTLSYSLRSSTSPNNDLWGSYANFSNGDNRGFVQRYVQYRSTFTQLNLVDSPGFIRATITYTTTGTFVTQCITPPSTISGWGTLSCNTSTSGGGALTFYSTSAATCGALATASQLGAGQWTATTNGGNITVTTNTAYALRFDSTLTSSTDTAQVNACTINWNVGTTPPPVWGIYAPVYNAIYWSGDVNNSTSTNRTFKYDLDNLGWFPLDLSMQAPLFYKNSLYFGSGYAGTWNLYGQDVYSDNGGAINSYWISKDWNLGEAFQEKTLASVSLVAINQGSGNLTVTGSADGFAANSYTVAIGTVTTTSYIRDNYRVPINSPFTFFNVEFSNSNANNPWSILGYRLDYTLSPWRPLGPP